MPWIQSQIKQRDGLLTRPFLFPLLSSSLSSSSSSPSPSLPSTYQKESTPSSSSGSKINPAVLFIIVILAVIFFISGLLHLLVRFLIKHRSSSSISQSNRYPEMSPSDAFQRQLRQLFHLHDSGLDQAYIDALPLFHYREVMGLKEPFDCAVCLCEFSEQDNLRLLPLCSHAFHIDCIDTWLLSNSTCPLCRGTLFSPGFSIENPVFDFDDSREEDGFSGNGGQKPAEHEIVSEKRVFPVILGKFRSTNDGSGGGGGGGGGGGERVEGGETSGSNLDARRCYSMGSFQYVVANSDLQVALCPNRGGGNVGADVKGRVEHTGNSSVDGDSEGKKINIGSKGESFSVSKIWLWSKKGKLASPSDTHMVSSSVNLSLPWNDRPLAT
uniref:RING-type E3 ubiquitin transferase n=1 Tax=Davidia involucrata TaxID=16924 RepID=A0A5B6ZLD0_DAVIN